MGLRPEQVEFDGALISEKKNPEHFMELSNLVTCLQGGSGTIITAAASNTSSVSPPPFMGGAAEIEIDLRAGKIIPVDYAAVVDCGTVINSIGAGADRRRSRAGYRHGPLRGHSEY